MKGQKLIFLVSQPRSGSTLLSTLISNSPKVHSCPEETWGLLPFLSFDRIDLNKSVYGTELASKAMLNYFTKATILEQLNIFLTKLYSIKANLSSTYILDKTPRYYEILNEIVDCFPNAKIIVLRRNPLDVFASIYLKWPQKRLFDFVYFGRDIINAPLIIDKFLKIHKSNPNVYPIKYDALVLDAKKEMQQIFNWLDIPFEEKHLKYKKIKKPDFGDDKFINHNHAHSHSLENWKDLLNNKNYKSFIEGYIYYLLKNKFSDYNLNSYKNRPTFRFKSFQGFHSFLSNYNQDFSLNYMAKYIKFYALSKIL